MESTARENDRDVELRDQVYRDVAFAVRRSAPEPATVALGQFPHRRIPLIVTEGRLDVVVKVEQDGRCALRAGNRSGDRLAPVARDMCGDVLHADIPERRQQPVDHPVALLDGELMRIVHRPETDHLREI